VLGFLRLSTTVLGFLRFFQGPRYKWVIFVVVGLLRKRKVNNKNNNTQSSKNKFNYLSFALRLRPGRYYVREEFPAFNGTVAVQERLREPLHLVYIVMR
jgi:hypothetical protein